jgi:hypothetical protein
LTPLTTRPPVTSRQGMIRLASMEESVKKTSGEIRKGRRSQSQQRG